MILRLTSLKDFFFYRLGIISLLFAFMAASCGICEVAQAQAFITLPSPGTMVATSVSFKPLELKGILVNIKNPLRFDFLIDKGDSHLYGQPLKDEIIRSTKYFLTCLTIPEDDLWVNLSPYEKDRIVPGNFGFTLMGRDLLAQDYLLKQIMASLSYPENDLGKRFWQRVYRRAYELYGTTDIPINTFNKVWILPKSADVYAQGNSAFVVNSQLDVMLEADYKAFIHHSQGLSQNAGAYSQIFRDVILPELRQEINEGKNFAIVRQVYNAMILATWYKRHLRDSLLGKMYIGQNKVGGVDIADKDAKEKIFQQYLRAYKKCVYNYIKEDYDPITNQTVPRKYASGGMRLSPNLVYEERPNPQGMKIGTDLAMATVDVTAINSEGGIVRFPFWKAEVTDTHPFHQVPFEVYGYRDGAMFAGLRKFINNWTAGIMFAVAVAAMTPNSLQGATFIPGDNGKVIVQVENGDQLGKVMEKIRMTYKKISPEQFKKSSYAGPIYAAMDRVIDAKDRKNFKRGERIQFIEPIPKNVLEVLTAPVARALQSGIATTEDDSDPQSILRNYEENRESAATVLTKTPAPQFIGDASASQSDQKGFWSTGKISLIFTVLLGIGGLRTNGYTLSGLMRKKRKKISAIPPGSPPLTVHSPNPSVVQTSANENNVLDVALPPPMASKNEEQILGYDLTQLQAIANGTMAPPPAIPAEESAETAKSSGQSFWWMDAGALLGGISLSLCFSGGIMGILAMNPFIVRDLYVIQKFLHEICHRIAASILYPSKFFIIWKSEDLKTNLSLEQSVNSLIPFTRMQPSYANLPFATPENGWLRNKLVGWAGFIGTAGLALSAGYFMGMTPFLAPLVLSGLAVLKGSVESGDLYGSPDTDEGKFGCGIIGFVKRVDQTGMQKKEMKPWLTWFFGSVNDSTVRGGQQAGVSNGFFTKKITKQKRNWLIWQTWDRGLVLYRNMIKDLYTRFYNALPSKLVPAYNYTKSCVLKFLGHVRFATGGAMVPEAAHPFTSPVEKREVWVFDSVLNKFRKVVRNFSITSAFNGDHEGSKIGVPYRAHLIERVLSFPHMRSFYSAAVHKYYEGRITRSYLKRTVSDGKEYKQRVPTNYGAVLRALRKKGYISFFGYVNDRFSGLDKEFKSWFPEYKEEVLNQIESSLFGIPPGDAPILPLEQHLDLTQGSWFASVRYAHVMSNHYDLEEAREDILFQREGRAVGGVFSEVYDQVEPFISRRGYVPEDPEVERSLNDIYVKDEKTAKSLGLEHQYQMILIFKDMLDKRMQQEAGQQTLAGKVFREWEEKWTRQGMNVEHMRELFINVAVEKFFTADNIAATKEFAESSDGTYGLFMSSSLDNSITLYQDNQDVVIGRNQTQGVYGFASTPNVLKSVGANGEKFEEVMHLKDGEVVNLSYSPSGKIIVRSWMRIGGEWKESSKEDLESRFYPTAEYVDGVKNQYYAKPPVQYDSPRRVVQEDLQNTPKILAAAQAELEDPDSFNSQSTDYLSERIADTIKKNGRARLVIIGYDNSRNLSEKFKDIADDLVDKSKLEIEVIDSNKFNNSPSKYNIKPDDIVLVVSKSGATSSTKLALRIIKALVDPENIFCMSARIDSVLFTMIGQGLRPGKDKFTKRCFITGEFYPAETPVVSEVLLMFQLQQLAVNLARKMQSRNDPQNKLGLKFSSERLEQIAPKITENSIRMSQELTGFDINGNEYPDTNKEIKSIGIYLGKAALETWKTNRFMDLFIAGVLSSSGLLLSHYIGSWGGLEVILDVIWIKYIVPFLITETLRKSSGRSAYGRDAPFKLFIAASPVLARTQRYFFSRILTNRFTAMGPAAIYYEDPAVDFVAAHASDQNRGDINLKFSLANKKTQGRMGVNQATFPQTAIFGTGILKGRPEVVDVVVNVPIEKDASPNEVSLMDDTIGNLGLMISAKTIGVGMAVAMSYDGRLFNLSSTFSSAGSHTTPINPINEEVRKILDSKREKVKMVSTIPRDIQAPDFSNNAMISITNERNPGGITMNSRLMNFRISGDIQNHAQDHNRYKDSAMPVVPINGVVPQVSRIVTVTPEMLKAMLGEGYLN